MLYFTDFSAADLRNIIQRAARNAAYLGKVSEAALCRVVLCCVVLFGCYCCCCYDFWTHFPPKGVHFTKRLGGSNIVNVIVVGHARSAVSKIMGAESIVMVGVSFFLFVEILLLGEKFQVERWIITIQNGFMLIIFVQCVKHTNTHTHTHTHTLSLSLSLSSLVAATAFQQCYDG